MFMGIHRQCLWAFIVNVYGHSSSMFMGIRRSVLVVQ